MMPRQRQYQQHDIPQLTTISPAIFTSIENDSFLMQPPKPPKGPPSSKAVRAEEIRASLEALDANARRVRMNIMALYRRECARLARDAHLDDKRDSAANTAAAAAGGGGGGGGAAAAAAAAPAGPLSESHSDINEVAATTATEKDLDMMMTNMETESTPAMEQMVGQSIARAPDFSRHVAGDVPPGGGGPGGGPPGRVLPPLSRKEVWVAKIESVLAGELVDLKGYDAYVAATRQRYLAQLEMAQREA